MRDKVASQVRGDHALSILTSAGHAKRTSRSCLVPTAIVVASRLFFAPFFAGYLAASPSRVLPTTPTPSSTRRSSQTASNSVGTAPLAFFIPFYGARALTFLHTCFLYSRLHVLHAAQSSNTSELTLPTPYVPIYRVSSGFLLFFHFILFLPFIHSFLLHFRPNSSHRSVWGVRRVSACRPRYRFVALLLLGCPAARFGVGRLPRSRVALVRGRIRLASSIPEPPSLHSSSALQVGIQSCLCCALWIWSVSMRPAAAPGTHPLLASCVEFFTSPTSSRGHFILYYAFGAFWFISLSA